MYWYVEELVSGNLNGIGSYDIVVDKGVGFVWDGCLLFGVWLLLQVLDQVCVCVVQYGIVGVVICNCYYICVLLVYMCKVMDWGLIVQILVLNLVVVCVVFYGGIKLVLILNLIVMGFLILGDLILVDVLLLIIIIMMMQFLVKQGECYFEEWGLIVEGVFMDDLCEIMECGGLLMLLGGVLKGYKGFGLVLMVDLLGQGLLGKGWVNIVVLGLLV